MPDCVVAPVVILGLGFTTQRLALRLLERDIPVFAAVRRPERFLKFEQAGVRLREPIPEALPNGAVLIYSVPPLAEPERSAMRSLIAAVAPRRIIYISSTGVYGARTNVDADTPAAPDDEKGHARLDEEKWLTGDGLKARPWSTLILRSAAIYGPGRGVHVRLREGKLPRGAGGVVSRIHVDDLAALLEAGIGSEIEGAWPVADEYPATSPEVIVWCANRMGLTLPVDTERTFPVSGRSVDGTKIRQLLGVTLKYESYRAGIVASLAEEQKEKDRTA